MSTIRGQTAHPMTPWKASHLLVTGVAILLGADSWAQPESSGPEQSLQNLDALTPQALIAAIEANNLSLQSVAAAAEAAMLRVKPAGSLEDPVFTYAIAPHSIGSDINVRHVGQFSQPLPWPGKRDLRRTVAMHKAEAAAQETEATRLQLLALAHNSFAEWHFLHRAIEINSTTHALMSELTRVAEARYAAGRSLQQDVLQAEVEAVLLEERQLALEHDRISLRAQINALLNRDPADPLPPPAAIASPVPLPDIQALRQSAEASHPEIRRIEAEVAAASSRVDLADKAFLPDFSANLGYVGTLDPSDKRLQIGVSINVPFNRNRRRSELDAASADLRRDQYELAARRLEILAKLESAYTHTHHAVEVIRLYEEQLLQLAQNNLDAAIAGYTTGTVQFLNVVTAQRQLLETEQRYERARSDYWRMRAELEQAAGGRLPGTGTATATTSGAPTRTR